MKNTNNSKKMISSMIAFSIFIVLILIGYSYYSKINQQIEIGGNSLSNNKDKNSLVELKILVIGTEPLDFTDVIKQANKIFNKEIGVELIVEFLGEENLSSEYHAIFAGGADFDLIQCFPYHYNQYAAKAAYMKLTDDMLKKCTPTTFEKFGNTIINEIRVCNNLYMIPSSGYLERQQVLLVRGDLLEESGISEINTIKELESYFSYIKENISVLKPLNIGYNAYNLIDFLYAQPNDIERYDDSLFMVNKGSKEENIFWLPEDDLCVEIFEIINRWSKEGYIPSNASSKNSVMWSRFFEGKSASYLSNIYEIESLKNYILNNKPEFKPQIVTLGNVINQVRYPLDHGIAVKNGTTHAAKSLMVIELINTNKELFRLLNYGIQGVHYSVSPDGFYIPLLMNDGYPIYNNYIWCMNEEFKLKYKFSDEVLELNEVVRNNKHKAVNMRLEGLKLDEINRLNKNLLYPITLGNFDIIKNLQIYKKKIREVGFNRYYEEVMKCINY